MATVQNMDKIKERLSQMMSASERRAQLGQDHQSLEDLVYQRVRDKIIYHELKPSERIIDAKLAEEFGVSRSLVRQALTILEKEELVVSIPRRGFYGKDISKKDVQEIYDIRKLLEVFATELAVPNLPENQIAQVEEIFRVAREDLKEGVVESTIEADMRLHGMITEYCGNERLKKMIKQYNNLYVFYRIVDLSQINRANISYVEHYEILEAVKARDVQRAKELMGQHIENAREIILQNFNFYTFGINEV